MNWQEKEIFWTRTFSRSGFYGSYDPAVRTHQQNKSDSSARSPLLKASAATSKQLDLVRLHEQNKKNLEQEIASYRDESAKQRKIIFQLEKEREKYINETSDLNHRNEYRSFEQKIEDFYNG